MKRIQKMLSEAGVASRRKAEQLIKEGRVTVNGRVAMLGESAADADEITVDGRPLAGTSLKKIYIALNKPAGYVVTASDPEGRPTVMTLVEEIGVRLFPVGRLDIDTSGLIFMTNDGDWANTVSHPRHNVEKTYRAQVKTPPRADALKSLREGVLLDGRRTAPARVKMLDDGRLEIIIHEGRNRQVRRMCETVGHPVVKLTRMAIGNVKLGRLTPGAWRHLTPAELKSFGQNKKDGEPC